MEPPIPEHWKKLWDEWNLRGFIILSLSLQTFLVLFAPLRKRTASNWTMMPLWSAYLLADWAAGFAVGLISSTEGTDTKGRLNNNDLLAFWAPFLLVHLGGPDTITAFSLEDNELWLRHLVNLVFQCLAAAYVFFQSIPNKLTIPILLMFLTGIIKYAERTRALYLASMNSFRDSMLTEPDPGPNYAKLMDEYFSKKEAKLPTRIQMIPEPNRITKAVNAVKEGDLEDPEVVFHAYRFFETFKGLIVDLIFSFRERKESRDFFLKRTAKDAFRVVEVELNFIYEVLYTKVSVVHSLAGHIFRTISFCSVVVALVLFYLIKDKQLLDTQNIRITYTLLFGSIALDIMAFIKLIFSDWTAIALKKSPELKPGGKSFSDKFLHFLFAVKNQTWCKDSRNPFFCCLGSPVKVITRRWSESVCQYNFIYYCLHQRSEAKESIIGYLGLSGFLDGLKYVKNERFTEGLRDFIFQELLMKSRLADDLETAKEICAARGDWILRVERCDSLLDYIEKLDYDESLLLWHIATELCYNDETEPPNTNAGQGRNADNKYRDYAKILSDYMLYLLVLQPTMMSTVAGIGQIRFRDTSAEAIKFFKMAKQGQGQDKVDPEKGKVQRACKSILNVHTAVKPVTVKGDRSKSVLFDACILAKELRRLKEKKWVIMSRVWVELMSYAACHCRANTHAQQLSKGGELLTIVWLLMAHFGLGDQFQISEGHARAKLIVGK